MKAIIMFVRTRLQGVLAVVIASILWGTTGTAAYVASELSALAIGAFAMGVGGFLLCVHARHGLIVDIPRIRQMPLVLVLGSLCVVFYPLAFYSAMRLSGVTIGTLVSIASAPFFAAVVERLFCKKVFSLTWILSFLIGIMGIALLSSGRAKIATPAVNDVTQTFGILLGLMAGLTYAGYSTAVKYMINKGINSKSAMASLFGVAAIILLPSLFFTGQNLFTTAENTMMILYIALIPMFLGYLLYGFGLRTIEASTATMISLIEPLVAAILAVWVLDEVFLPIGWLGMGLVCLCLFIQSLHVVNPGK
jgi:DME family drug/metabolite transporter